MGSNPLVVDSCDNIIILRRALVHLESVTSQWKHAGLIFRLSDVYHSVEYGISLVHVYGKNNSGGSASALTHLASLNVQLDALSEYIMASLISSPAQRTPLVVGLSDPYKLPSVSIFRVPVHSNSVRSIVYEISKHRQLQYWVDRKLTHMENGIGLNSHHLNKHRIGLPSICQPSSQNVWVTPYLTWKYYSNKYMHPLTSARTLGWSRKQYSICID